MSVSLPGHLYSTLLYSNVEQSKNTRIGSDCIISLSAGHLEWTDKAKKQCMIMWRSPEEWGKLIYQWVRCSSPRFLLNCGHLSLY